MILIGVVVIMNSVLFTALIIHFIKLNKNGDRLSLFWILTAITYTVNLLLTGYIFINGGIA